LPSINTGSNAWIPSLCSVGARFSSTGCSRITSASSLESRVIVTGKTTTGVNLRERWWNVCPRIASDFHRAMSSGILSKTELTSAALSHTIISIIFSFLLFSLLFLFSFLFSFLSLCCILFLKNHKMRRKTSSFYRLSIRIFFSSVDAHPHGLIKNHHNTIFPPFYP